MTTGDWQIDHVRRWLMSTQPEDLQHNLDQQFCDREDQDRLRTPDPDHKRLIALSTKRRKIGDDCNDETRPQIHITAHNDYHTIAFRSPSLRNNEEFQGGERCKAQDSNTIVGRHSRPKETHPHVINSQDTQHLAAKAKEKYARRRRHNIRPDRYDYNEKASTEDLKRDSRSKEKKKRHSHKRSGSNLNRDFRAPNVEPQRLTLKEQPRPGIFRKGKASAPMECRGIPDLTFSEMTFLNRKRELTDARHRAAQAQVQPAITIDGNTQAVPAYLSRLGLQIPGLEGRGDITASTDAGRLSSQADRLPRAASKLHTTGRENVTVVDGAAQRAIEARQARHQFLEPDGYSLDQSSKVSWSPGPVHSARTGPKLKRLPHHTSRSADVLEKPHTIRKERFVQPRSSTSKSPLHYDHIGTVPCRRQTPIRSGHDQRRHRHYYSLEDLMEMAHTQSTSEKLPLEDQDDKIGAAKLADCCVSPRLGNSHDDRVSARLLALPDDSLMPQWEYKVGGRSLEASGSGGILFKPPAADDGYEGMNARLRDLDSGYVDLIPKTYMFADHMTDELDAFDYALLATQSAQEGQGDASKGTLPVQGQGLRWTVDDRAQPDGHVLQAESDAASPNYQINTPARSRIDYSTSASVRPQLLRPSREKPSYTVVFQGFSRPRLLY